MVDLNALAVFARVVEAGSFTGGAKALGLPKGSVSRKISTLEADLGVRLLHRTTRKLSLTEVGRAYYEQCRRGLVELEAANRLVGESRAAPMGILRISAPIEFGSGVLGDWVELYLRRHDQAKVELVLSDRRVDLIEERIDLAFRTGKLQDSSFIARKIGPTRRVICASPDYLRRRGQPGCLSALQDHDAIVHGTSVEGAQWRLRGPKGDVTASLKARAAGDSMGFVRRAALSGLGIALLPEAIAAVEIKAGRLKPVLQDYATEGQGIYAVYPSSRQLSSAVRAFLDIVVEQTDPEAPWRLGE
ncbi:MAG: LysR family transcriptional regulator [Pseudomonadota bacterium]